MNKGLGASPDGDRAAGLRPQPPAASSQSSIPSAGGLLLVTPGDLRGLAKRLGKARCWHTSVGLGFVKSTKWFDLDPFDIVLAARLIGWLASGMEARQGGDCEDGRHAEHDSPAPRSGETPK